MTFSKFIAANSELQSAIFDSDHGALFAINGRLSGFYPFPVANGDPGTPGISSTSLTGGGTARSITVNLSTPDPADDLRFAPSQQRTSFAIANGVILESDAIVPIDMTIIEAEGVTLVDPDPISIFVTYDNYGADPVFDIKRESVIDASPQMIAKLAFYDPETQTWLPYPSVSLGGIYRRLVDIVTRLDGFRVTIDAGSPAPRRLLVSPGFITGQFGRIINSSVSIVIPPAPPLILGQKRKDVLFVNDPAAENLPITFTMLQGVDKTYVLPATVQEEPPSRPDSPRMVALAEIIYDSTGVKEVIDVRPVQAWATDAAQQRDPDLTDVVNIETLQPGLAMTDLVPGSNNVWEVLIMRGKSPILGSPVKSRFVIGLTGPEVERTFAAPDSGSLTFVPTSGQFPPVPYVIKSSLKMVSVTTGLDVTNDPNYAINFDLLNGRFVPAGISAQSFGELIRVTFRQLRVLFAIDDDDSVSIPELVLIRKHISRNAPFYLPENASNPNGLDTSDPGHDPNRNLPYTTIFPENPAAHTGSNLVFENGPLDGRTLPGGNANPEVVSVQRAIEILASTTRPPPSNPLAGKQFSINWRATNVFMLVDFVKIIGDPTDRESWDTIEAPNFYHFIGPSGDSVPVNCDEQEDSWPLTPPINANGIKFPFSTAKVLGGSVSFFGTDTSIPLPASVNNDIRFRIWINNQNFELTHLTNFVPGNVARRLGTRGIFTVDDPLTTLITTGSMVRLATLGPTDGNSGGGGTPGRINEWKLRVDSLSVNLFVELI